MPRDQFERLNECDYSISPCCGLCKKADFANHMTLWGSCTAHYLGNKDQPLSIHRMGKCGFGFTPDPEKIAIFLQAYGVLLRGESFWEDLAKCAEAFYINLEYQDDEDCPENCCWVVKSPFLPPDFNPAYMGRTEALKKAVQAIKAFHCKKTEK